MDINYFKNNREAKQQMLELVNATTSKDNAQLSECLKSMINESFSYNEEQVIDLMRQLDEKNNPTRTGKSKFT